MISLTKKIQLTQNEQTIYTKDLQSPPLHGGAIFVPIPGCTTDFTTASLHSRSSISVLGPESEPGPRGQETVQCLPLLSLHLTQAELDEKTVSEIRKWDTRIPSNQTLLGSWSKRPQTPVAAGNCVPCQPVSDGLERGQ